MAVQRRLKQAAITLLKVSRKILVSQVAGLISICSILGPATRVTGTLR